MLKKSHVSVLAIHLPSLELGRAAVLGRWERHEVCGEEELQLSHGRAPASPLGAAACSDPGQQQCPRPWGFQWSTGPGELVLPSPLWGENTWAPGSPSEVTPSSASAQRDSCLQRLAASYLLQWIVWAKLSSSKHFGYYWSPPYQGEDFSRPH